MFVDFFEATRIVMRAKCDSTLVDEYAPDDFLRYGGRRTYAYGLSDDSWNKLSAALTYARWFLGRVLPIGEIDGRGHCVAERPGSRPIAAAEWSTYFIDLQKNELSNLPGTTPIAFPTIVEVRINAKHLELALRACLSRHAGGRPPTHNWDAIKAEAFRVMDKSPKIKRADLATKLMAYCSGTFSKEPSYSALQKRLTSWLKERPETPV